MKKQITRRDPYFGDQEDRLDPQLLRYYHRVSETIKDGFENSEYKELFLENVFKQLCEDALAVSCNQSASTIVESLLSEATPPQLAQFMTVISKDWKTAITNPFCSHVVETLLFNIAPYFNSPKQTEYERSGDNSESQIQTPKSIFLELCETFAQNIEQFLEGSSCYVIINVLEILAGQRMKGLVISKKTKAEEKNQKSLDPAYIPPEEFSPKLFELTEGIINVSNLRKHTENPLENAVLQVALLILKERDTDRCRNAVQSVINKTALFDLKDNEKGGNGLPSLMTHMYGSFFVEQLYNVAPDDIYDELLEQLLPILHHMSQHPVANFSLQRLINHLRTADQLKQVFSVLCPELENIMASSYVGVIHSLAKACLLFKTKMKKLIKALLEVFHCATPESRLKFVPLLLTLSTFEMYESNPSLLDNVTYHGSVLLQTLLKFDKPHLLINGMLNLKPDELLKIAHQQPGSHVFDALVDSEAFTPENHEELLTSLQGFYSDLCSSQPGSRVFDALWNHAAVDQRKFIITELARSNTLKHSASGRFCYNKFSVQLFQSCPGAWIDIQSKDVRKRKIITETIFEPQKKKKKKKKKS